MSLVCRRSGPEAGPQAAPNASPLSWCKYELPRILTVFRVGPADTQWSRAARLSGSHTAPSESEGGRVDPDRTDQGFGPGHPGGEGVGVTRWVGTIFPG